MRILFTVLLAVIPVTAQVPIVRLHNASHPLSRDFQVGDRFEILLTGAPRQPVSVRTTLDGRTDWGPIIGSTDSTGSWSIAGQFEKSDFGDWSEVWTVGGMPASTPVQFAVRAPCLPGGQYFAQQTGLMSMVSCETAEGRQTFSTLSESESFRTPDGRLVPGHSAERTQEAYHMGILQDLICRRDQATGRIVLQSSRGGLGDGTADLIMKLIGVNALNADETRNVLAIIHAAFEKPETIAPTARVPVRTSQLLQCLAAFTDQQSVQRQIAETVEYVQQTR